MGPDEYYAPVNNSIYTNLVAQQSLRLPNFIKNTFNVSGEAPSPDWTSMADKIYIPFDSVRNYHPEFEGYTYGMDGFIIFFLGCDIRFNSAMLKNFILLLNYLMDIRNLEKVLHMVS